MAKKSVKLPKARNPLAVGVKSRTGAGAHEKSKKVLRRNNKMNLRGEWMKKSSVPLDFLGFMLYIYLERSRTMASWVITDKINGKCIETFDVATMQHAKTLPRYKVEPILEYLYRINEEIMKGNQNA